LSAEAAALLLILQGDPVEDDTGASAPAVTQETQQPYAPSPPPASSGIAGDFGSEGSAARGSTIYVNIPPGGRWSAPLTTSADRGAGRFGWVPTSYALPLDGSAATGWLEDPQGNVLCTGARGFEVFFFWRTPGQDIGYGCMLEHSTTYTIIIEVCMGGRDTPTCYGQQPGTQQAPIYVQGVLSN
jgi:hypothetical protein